MTARCGSTLVSQIVAAGVPKTRVMSEPWAFVHLNGLYLTGKISNPQLRVLLRSTFRLQCKPEKQSNPDLERIFIKMSHLAGSHFPMLKELFPNHIQIFNTRLPQTALQSYTKVAQWAPWVWIVTGLRKRFFDTHQILPYHDLAYWDHWRRIMANNFLQGVDIPSRTVAFWMAAGIQQYTDTKDNYACAIIYEDLRADPAKVIGEVFEAMGVPLECLAKGLEALKEDAQKGTFGEHGAKINVTPAMEESYNSTLKECGSPLSMDMSLDDLRRMVYT